MFSLRSQLWITIFRLLNFHVLNGPQVISGNHLPCRAASTLLRGKSHD